MKFARLDRLLLIAVLCLGLSGCLGTAVGLVVDTAIEVAKVPFKVGGAVIDVVSGDEDKASKEKGKAESDGEEDKGDEK
ncbi:MAG: NF038104 family lipoprotein [Arenicella sp.]|nr:NF038104 family lipoprotein [Arenicella sp.]